MIFLNYASSVAALVFHLPGMCTHTNTKGKQREARVRNIFQIFWKKTQYLLNTLYQKHKVKEEERKVLKGMTYRDATHLKKSSTLNRVKRFLTLKQVLRSHMLDLILTGWVKLIPLSFSGESLARLGRVSLQGARPDYQYFHRQRQGN